MSIITDFIKNKSGGGEGGGKFKRNFINVCDQMTFDYWLYRTHNKVQEYDESIEDLKYGLAFYLKDNLEPVYVWFLTCEHRDSIYNKVLEQIEALNGDIYDV